MDSAVTALQLVLCEDPDRAEELAHKLNEINAKRQETELQIFKAAEELLEQQPERLEDRVILLWGRDWAPRAVIGIVASRLVERTGRPVIVVTVDEHGECKAAAAACRVSTCTPASGPAPTCSSATVATPWRRASRCGKKIWKPCAAA